MLALLAALFLGAASQAWAAHPGCDSLCSHQGVVLSCRVRIRWSMKHTTFRDEPNPCGLARDHVLELCPSCAGCSPESLGDECREAILRRVRNGSANGSQGAAAGALHNSSADGSVGNASTGDLNSPGLGALQNSSTNGSAGNASAVNLSSVLQNSSANDSSGNDSASNLSGANSSEHAVNASKGKSAGRRHGKRNSSSAGTSSSASTNTTSTSTSTTRTSTTNTTSTMITTTTTTSETFCCSAAIDDDDFCGTCWENAPMMGDSYCRTSKETCEKCGHRWCNHTKIIKPSCKAYGCIPFKPFNECQCNPECAKFGSCCDDYEDVCEREDNHDDDEEVLEEAPRGAKAAAASGVSSPQTSWSDEVLEDAREAVHAMRAKRSGHHGKGAHGAEQPARPHGKQPGSGGTQPGLSEMSAVSRGAADLLPEAKARFGAAHVSLALALGLVVSGAAVVARRGCWQWTPVATSQQSAVLPLAPPEE